MEKFSKFNDPCTGINPFIQQPYRKISIWKIILNLPLYLISFLFPLVLFKIKSNIKIKNKIEIMICNASSDYDILILKKLFKIKYFYFLRNYEFYDLQLKKVLIINKPCVLFVEGERTNNRSILTYSCPYKIDAVCFIKYDSVFCYGSKFKYLLNILSNDNIVNVKAKDSNDPYELKNMCGYQVKFTWSDKNNFYKLLNNKI